MIRGLFFDLDGTLVDTYEADYLAYRDAIAEVTGVIVEQAEYAKLHGMEIGAKLAVLVPDVPESQYGAIRQAKKVAYKSYLHKTQTNETLVKFLAQFTNHQQCVMVTTAKRDNVESVLRHHGLFEYFSLIISGDDVGRAKPHPEPYLLALERTGLNPHEVIAFEDSQAGIDSAEAAGIPVIEVKEFAVS